MTVIYPVLVPVDAFGKAFAGRKRVAHLSDLARRALYLSAKKSGVTLDRLDKDDRGAPLPFEGTHWSVSHKETFVAGVAAPAPIGIDVERIRPCDSALFRKTGTGEEWALGDGPPDDHLFFRYWTAKEAVLKTSGAGFREFSQCRVKRLVDDRYIILGYRGREWMVEHCYFKGHMAAVVKDGWEIVWTVGDSGL
jgi:4'-phosphopantetheinyl transferase